ncbi:MAG: thioesterase, partial [Mesorhizobium sp.]
MYVWGRMARTMATASSRGPYRAGEESRLAFRCLPIDIDFNLHLNNARYMMLADLGRIDIFLRIGLIALARKNGWAPMIGGLQVAYVREIRLWRRFDVVSSIETWEGTSVIGRHRFVLDGGETAALILTTGGVYD